MAADGYIIVESGIETDGFVKGTKELEAACRRSAASVSAMGGKAALAVTKAVHAIEQQNAAYRRQEARVEALRQKIRKASETRIETDAFRRAQAEVDRLTKKIDGAIERQLRFVETGGNTKSTAFERMEYDVAKLREALTEAINKKNALLSSGGAYTSADTSALVGQLEAAEERLAAMGNRLETSYASLQQRTTELASSHNRLKDSMSAAGRSMNSGLRTMLKYGLGIRSTYILVNKLRSALVDGLTELAKYDGETANNISGLKNSLNGLKGSLTSAFAPLANFVIPYLIRFINWLARGIEAVGMFIATLTGKDTYKKAVTGITEVGDAITETSSAAKEAQRNLSGLDELNIWQNDTGSGSSGGSGVTSGGSGSSSVLAFEDTPINLSGALSNVAEFIRGNLESVELLADEFALVLGMILTFSGANIPLGLAMMAYGGYKLYQDITTNWDAISQQLQGPMGAVMGIVGGALLAVGAILTFSGANIPLGIGLMAVGAATLATVTALNWDTLQETLNGQVGAVTYIVSLALLAVGAILAFSGVALPLGIAMMAVGAVGVVATTALDWDTMKTRIKAALGPVVTALGGALLAVGAILAFSGVALPLGIALMAAGAAGLATAATLNWDTLKKSIGDAIDKVKSLFSSSDAKLVIGFLLCHTPAGLPLGISLIKDALGSGNNSSSDGSSGPIKEFGQNILSAAKEAGGSIKEWWKGLWEDEDTDIPVTADFKETKDSLSGEQKHVGVTGVFGSTDPTKLTDAQKTVSATAKFDKADTALLTGDKKPWSYATAWFNAYGKKSDGEIDTNYFKRPWSYGTVWYNAYGKNGNGEINTSYLTRPWSYGDVWFNKWSEWKISPWSYGKLWYNAWEEWGIDPWSYATAYFDDYENYLGKPWWYAKAYFDDYGTSFYEPPVIKCVADITSVNALDSTFLGRAVGGVYAGGVWRPIQQYATGGSPGMGQLFVAREAGPELVGTLGGHTAVMNNDQIVASVSAGVARAVAVVMSGMRFYSSVSYAPYLDDITTLLSVNTPEIAARLREIQASIDTINSTLPAFDFDIPIPIMATGTVVPPRAMQASGEMEALRDSIAAAGGYGVNRGTYAAGGGNVYNVAARVNQHTLFDVMLDEAELRKAQSGMNPFAI